MRTACTPSGFNPTADAHAVTATLHPAYSLHSFFRQQCSVVGHRIYVLASRSSSCHNDTHLSHRSISYAYFRSFGRMLPISRQTSPEYSPAIQKCIKACKDPRPELPVYFPFVTNLERISKGPRENAKEAMGSNKVSFRNARSCGGYHVGVLLSTLCWTTLARLT